MKKLNIYEFRDYLTNKNPNIITYTDQDNNCQHSPVFLNLAFDSIQIFADHPAIPHKILLKGDNGLMYFDYVEEIQLIPISSNCSLFGDEAIIICKKKNTVKKYSICIN